MDNLYGYTGAEEVTPGKQGGVFGLNQGVFVTKFEFNPNAGKDGTPGEAVDFTVQIQEREYMKRLFPITKVFGENGEITDTNSKEYEEGFAKEVKLLNAELTSIVEAFVGEEAVKAALNVPIRGFKDFAMILERLVKSVPNWDKTPVDVFLQYQWAPKGDNTRTYLELPKNVKQGIYITKSDSLNYTEVRTDTSLKYVVEDQGIEHPFKRGKWFVESAFANLTTLETNVGGSSMNQNQAAGTNW